MTLCKVCFQEAENGIVVPGYVQALGVVHEECLAAAALKLAEDSQKEGQLRYLIEYEEKHAPHGWSKDVSGESADISWQWTDVGIPAAKIRGFLNVGLVSIIFSTNSSKHYSLVGRDVLKETLGKKEELMMSPPSIAESSTAVASIGILSISSKRRILGWYWKKASVRPAPDTREPVA